MIDLSYYNAQISDQLDGARNYIKRAIKLKAEHADWSSTYAKMSEAELGHAENLMTMFDQDLKLSEEDADDEVVQILQGFRATMSDMYVESVAKVKYMYEIYRTK